MTNKIPAWSFSSLKTFTTCPKKFYHAKVAKDVKEPEGEAALYGKEVHSVAEFYVRDGKPIPAKFDFIKPALDSLIKIPGDKHCEFKVALTESLEPCDFFDKECWFRGVADLLIINEEKGEARVIDYKLGKSRYADLGQLELMALAVFKIFPKITVARANLSLQSMKRSNNTGTGATGCQRSPCWKARTVQACGMQNPTVCANNIAG